MITEFLLNFGQSLLMSLVIMTVLWAVTEWLKDSSLVDTAWSLCIALLGLHFLSQPESRTVHSFAAGTLLLLWALRLSIYIFKRNHGKGEDPRYTELKNKWGEKQKIRMLQFFWMQGAAAALFSLPFILVGMNTAPGISIVEWLGAAGVLAGIAGEASSDASLARFKANPANRGKTCRDGLWNYSRHPNYFFEWLTWCGFALFASASPMGWLAWLCPAAMFHFLVNVTGIPKTEEQALKSRGDDYREYQRTTSKFIPWFKKK